MDYDAIIIGGGPAGLSAGLYLSRANKKTAIIERLPAGGEAGRIPEVVNYPGILSLSGYEIVDNMTKQAKAFGADFIVGEVVGIDSGTNTVTLKNGKTFSYKTLIYGAGCVSKKLGISGESDLEGRGISYCATCDGGFFKDKTVAVTGSGIKAENDVKYLLPIAKKVYFITDGENELSGAETVKGRVIGFNGIPLESVKVFSKDKQQQIEAACLFVSIGVQPVTHLLSGSVVMDEKGFILTDENMRTNKENIFAVGDVRKKDLRQIVTAASDGAIAATSVIKYLAKKK